MSTIYRISRSLEQVGGEGKKLSLQAQNPGLDCHSAKLQVNKPLGPTVHRYRPIKTPSRHWQVWEQLAGQRDK